MSKVCKDKLDMYVVIHTYVFIKVNKLSYNTKFLEQNSFCATKVFKTIIFIKLVRDNYKNLISKLLEIISILIDHAIFYKYLWLEKLECYLLFLIL